ADRPHGGRVARADALDQAWRPRFAADAIAPSPLGRVLAIAERLDTLAGGFAAGLRPTGNKDPFALRRNALGLARTVIESGAGIDLRACLSLAQRAALDACVARAEQALADAKSEKEAAAARQSRDALVAQRDGDATAAIDELYDFILDRLRGYYADRGVPVQHFNAVAALRPASLLDFDRRLGAIGSFASLPGAEALAAANKRIGNILRKADDAIPADVDRSRLVEPAEVALADAVEAACADTDAP